MKRLIILLSFVLSLASIANAQDKVCIKQGTKVSVIIVESMTSQKVKTAPIVQMASDVYDADGEVLIIKKGTPVNIQTNITKATLFGDEGSIQITPISTTSVQGRDISFEQDVVTFEGNDALLKSRKKAYIPARTAFTATIANDYCFKK